MNMNILAPKIGALQIAPPKNKMAVCLKIRL
jgi:hypothetical protein